MGLDNITQVINKAENLYNKLEKGVNFSDRWLDPKVWQPVLDQLNSINMGNPTE